MSKFFREINGDDYTLVEVKIIDGLVAISAGGRGEYGAAFLSIDQCAELIAAITEAAKELP